MFTLKAVKDRPGSTLEELWEYMYGQWGHNERVRWIVHGENYNHLRFLVDELTCVDNREGRYYFNDGATVYCARDKIFDFCVRDAVEKGQL